MNIFLRLILFISLAVAGQSYATTAMSYGYVANTVQPGVENLNNNGLINPSGCCSNLSSRDSQDRAQARAFFALAVDFYVPKAGGGAKVDNIPEAARGRIQDFANKYDTDVTVVGSRAKKTGGNGPDSDWDYIMSNPPGKLRKRGKQQLPKGRAGGEMGSGQDFLDGPVDPSRPHIIFTPEK